MKKNWTLPEFVEELNNSTDKVWNPRLVRHYASIGAISKPIKTGRNAEYTEQHLIEAQQVTDLQHMGLSISKVLKQEMEPETLKGNTDFHASKKPSLQDLAFKLPT